MKYSPLARGVELGSTFQREELKEFVNIFLNFCNNGHWDVFSKDV